MEQQRITWQPSELFYERIRVFPDEKLLLFYKRMSSGREDTYQRGLPDSDAYAIVQEEIMDRGLATQ